MGNHYLNTQYTIIHLKIINKVINNMYIFIGIYIFKFEPSSTFHQTYIHIGVAITWMCNGRSIYTRHFYLPSYIYTSSEVAFSDLKRQRKPKGL